MFTCGKRGKTSNVVMFSSYIKRGQLLNSDGKLVFASTLVLTKKHCHIIKMRNFFIANALKLKAIIRYLLPAIPINGIYQGLGLSIFSFAA